MQCTADEVFVVNHDSTLHRLWNQPWAIAQLQFAEIRALAPQIPTLREVISEFGGQQHLFIELKVPFSDAEGLRELLAELVPGKDYHLLTLDALMLSRLTDFPKAALLLVATQHNVHEFCNLSQQQHYGGVLGHYALLNDKLAHQLHAVGQQVGVGFVDSKYSLYREVNKGIRLLFTNRALALAQHLK